MKKLTTGTTKNLALASLLVAMGGGCLGGSGSTDGGSAKDPGYSDGVFVSSGSTTGTIKVDVEDTELAVGESTGFTVTAKNAEGIPVKQINVACDSEQGVAILEPQKGYELTNNNGVMSGRLACALPGSFQFVCRLAIGANRRQFVGIKCTGDVPAGFEGFPGAAGGGLGGGVQTSDSGDVVVRDAWFQDSGEDTSSSTTHDASIDITQASDCDGVATTRDPEPFYDTYVYLKVENGLTEQVRFTTLSYTFRNVDGAGTDFTSKELGLTADADSSVAANGGTKLIYMPVFKAYGGGKYVGDPSGFGIQLTQAALKTVSFTLRGETASGQAVSLTARITGSFSNFNRCPSS